jgi:TetR/AcrR family transcriptional regulator, regulator of cefoperazone and chloramphenicol sensitivity
MNDRDVTARAAIRNAALRLFADHGHDAVSVRQIASEAEVSPALVLHHFGSKAGLRQAVDRFAAERVDALMAQDEDVTRVFAEGDGSSIAKAFASVFPPDSPLPAYVRRLLLSGDPAGAMLFGKWFEASRSILDHMISEGLARQTDDPDVRAAFLLVSDLALLVLREPLAATLGFDPLSPQGMTRWADEVSVIARDGMFIQPTDDTAGPDLPTTSNDFRNEASE